MRPWTGEESSDLLRAGSVFGRTKRQESFALETLYTLHRAMASEEYHSQDGHDCRQISDGWTSEEGHRPWSGWGLLPDFHDGWSGPALHDLRYPVPHGLIARTWRFE